MKIAQLFTHYLSEREIRQLKYSTNNTRLHSNNKVIETSTNVPGPRKLDDRKETELKDNQCLLSWKLI